MAKIFLFFFSICIMSITIVYKSETNLLNNIKPNTAPIQSTNMVEAPPVKSSKQYNKKAIYAGVGFTALLGLLLLRGGKLLKGFQKLIEKGIEKKKPYEGVSLPDNTPIEVEVIDTRFLRRNSKLRLKPEIVDVEFQEIKD